MAGIPEIIVDPVFNPESTQSSQAVRLMIRPELDVHTKETFRLWLDNIPGIFFDNSQNSTIGYRLEAADEICEGPQFPEWAATMSRAFFDNFIASKFRGDGKIYEPVRVGKRMRDYAQKATRGLPPEKRYEPLKTADARREL